MKKVETPSIISIPIADSPVAPPRKAGERTLRQAPKRTDAYSPTTAAAQAQWERKPIYIPLGGDYVDIEPFGSPPSPMTPEGMSQQESLKYFEDKWNGPTVQNVIAAHMDSEDVNELSESGETQRGNLSAESCLITQEPPTSRIPATDRMTGSEQGTASNSMSGEATGRLLLGSKTIVGITVEVNREVRPEETVLPELLDGTGSTHSSTTLPEEALQSILPMELTGHSPTEVGVAEKLLPSPRESDVSGNVQGLEKTPVGSASVVREAIPGDLLSKSFPLSPGRSVELPIGVTTEPGVPDEPDVPVVPDVPDVPVVPDVPDAPDVPDVQNVPLVPDEPDETDLTDAPAETDVSAVAGVTGIIMPQDLSKSGSWSWRHGVRRYGVICVDRHSYATRGYKPLTTMQM